MKKIVALVVVLSIVVLARHAGGDGDGRFSTMALGFVLIAAALAGEAGEHIGLPRLTGYLLVGICAGHSVLDLVTPAMTTQLRLVNGLAVALIAFGAGMELDLHSLRGRWKRLATHGGVLMGLLFVGLFLSMFAATFVLPFCKDAALTTRLAISLVTAAVMTTFSPTVTIAVLSETRSKGPLAERVLQLVILGDLAAVMLFTLSTTGAQLLDGAAVDVRAAMRHVGWEVVGSLLLGAAVGLGLAAYRRHVNQRTGLVLAGTCLVLAEVGSRMGLSPLLCALAAGFVVRNTAADAVHEIEGLLERFRMPVLVVFFAAAGASLHLDQLARVGPIALGLALVRATLIHRANKIAARASRLEERVANHVPFGLVSQAGITLGLAVIVGKQFGEWGQMLETLFVATISLHELVGPIGFRWALGRIGELGAAGGREEHPHQVEVTPAPAQAV